MPPDDPPVAAGGRSRWPRRLALAAQRFWQPTSACLACMPGSFARITSVVHWEVALQTGAATAALVLLLTMTRAIRLFDGRVRNACTVGGLTALGDAYSHLRHDGHAGLESLVTGVVSGLLAFAVATIVAAHGPRVRAAWSRWTR